MSFALRIAPVVAITLMAAASPVLAGSCGWSLCSGSDEAPQQADPVLRRPVLLDAGSRSEDTQSAPTSQALSSARGAKDAAALEPEGVPAPLERIEPDFTDLEFPLDDEDFDEMTPAQAAMARMRAGDLVRPGSNLADHFHTLDNFLSGENE